MLCSRNSSSFRFREQSDRDRTYERERDQDTEPNRITRRLVAQVSYEHRHRSFGHSVGGQYYAHQTPHDFHPEEFGSNEWDDHVIAAEADAKDDCKKINGSRRRREE